MNVYYLEDPLNDEDVEFLIEVLAKREGLKSIQNIEQRRVASIFPSNNKYGTLDERMEKRISLMKNNLIKAGIKDDIGSQVTWVMPKDIHWGGIISMAIQEITGFMPYLVKHWHLEEDELVRGETEIIDMHGAFG